MKFYALTRPISYVGKTMLGFDDCKVMFSPAENIQGFEHLVLNGERITQHLVQHRNRRIEVRHGGNTIKAFEHYGPLRFLFPGLRISGPQGELPHVAFTQPLLDVLMEAAVPIEIDPQFYTVAAGSGYIYPKGRGGVSVTGTFFEPCDSKRLNLSVTVCFKKYGGEYTKNYTFPNEELLRQIFSVPPLGRPSWLKHPTQLLWHHGRNVFWAKKGDHTALEKIADHRALDLLGALALFDSGKECSGFFPSLRVASVCSGHLGDIKALNIIRAIPYPF